MLDKDNLPESLQDNTKLKKALTVLEVMNFTDAEREEYDDHLKWLQIQTNTIKNYEQKAEKRGRIKGRTEGMEAMAIEIAIAMIKADKPTEEVIQFTGLSRETITRLQIELQ